MRLTAREGCQLTGRNRRNAAISIGHTFIQAGGCDNAQTRGPATWTSSRVARHDLRQTHQPQDVELSAANIEGAACASQIDRCTSLCRPQRGRGGGGGGGVCLSTANGEPSTNL